MMGYFVCGFQVVFITVHLAPYLKDMALQYPDINGASVATTALALISASFKPNALSLFNADCLFACISASLANLAYLS